MNQEAGNKPSSGMALGDFMHVSLMRALPRSKPFKGKLGHDYAFSDQYGAFVLAARYCRALPYYPPPGIWQHGCFGPWDQVSPGAILYHSPALRKHKVFVAREDECKFLEKHGITNCAAIGLPFVYAVAPKVSRKKGSLLVLPVHTLHGMPSFLDNGELIKYAKQIHAIRDQFTEVVLCVHSGDVENDYWIREFGEMGIRWVLGADPRDANSLPRMKHLFLSFEYVTTNGWGSHVAYALSCGAKCSIWGVCPTRNPEIVLRDAGNGGAEQITQRFSDKAREIQDQYIAHLRVEPKSGVVDEDLGDFLIGKINKKNPHSIYAEFEWDQLNIAEKWKIAIENIKWFSQCVALDFARMVVPKIWRPCLRRCFGNKCS